MIKASRGNIFSPQHCFFTTMQLRPEGHIWRHSRESVRVRLAPQWTASLIPRSSPVHLTHDFGLHSLRIIPTRLTFATLGTNRGKVIMPERHREHHSWTYLQGAGDDEEHWSCGEAYCAPPPVFLVGCR